MPAVTALVDDGQRLRVVATTSLIGDVIARVGGDAIDLTVLMQPGQDPHSYQPGAADLTAVADAHLIFVNGWNLEEGLAKDLEQIGGRATLVPISAGIQPRTLDEAGGAADPHVWQNVAHVQQWAENARAALSAADPAHAALYNANAASYQAALSRLDTELRRTLEAIPPERRVLVTNHDNLGYFADAYGFDIAGAVIPSVSGLAEPTAGGLADLIEVMRADGLCAMIVEAPADQATGGAQTARALEGELTHCELRLIPLYTDALGAAGGGADSYEGMMRANAAALVAGLGE
jgi:ABC-type Zn uptake system ZnuABC Zn-binding protein ZnuA